MLSTKASRRSAGSTSDAGHASHRWRALRKSAFAVELARASAKPVVFIATAQALDEDMTGRIERHRRDRPGAWSLIEEPLELDAAVRTSPADACLVIDCLTMWTSNAMLGGLSDLEILERSRRAARAGASRRPPVIVVTNEVGSSVVPASDVARRYQDVLGRVNKSWSEIAASAYIVIAGRVLPLVSSKDVLRAGA
jgi:adenosylcobinamide kinase/adenosylcobinamide-phosphate guanylyltransferase